MISYQPLDTYPLVKTGDTYKFNIQVLDSSNREPKDLTDVTQGSYVFTRSNLSGEVLITKSLGNGMEILNALDGIVEITLDNADTKGLPAGLNYHEAKLKTSNARQFTILDEHVNVEEQQIKEIL